MEQNRTNQNSIVEIIDQIGLEAAAALDFTYDNETIFSGWKSDVPCRNQWFLDGEEQPTVEGWFPSNADESIKECSGESPINAQSAVMLVCTAHIVKELQELRKIMIQSNDCQ